MRLPDEVQKCVVFFGLKRIDKDSGSKRIIYGGTGFFVAINSELHGATYVILVTAAHVAKKIEHGEFFVRVNKKNGDAIEYRLDGGIDVVWHFHPTDNSIDGAIAVWAPPYGDDIDYLCVPSNMFLDSQKLEAKRIGTGDEVYVTGLFRLLHGSRRNLPIVRTGNLAMLPTDRIPVSNWQTKDVLAYLIEARSIGGSSGSPVFVQRSIKVVPAEHTGREPVAGGAVFWLGLVLGHWDDRKVRPADDWDHSIEVGLTVVVPSHQILEILSGDQIRAELKHRLETMEAEYHEVIIDGASPAGVLPGQERLAASVVSAPVLKEAASAYPSISELMSPSDGTLAAEFDEEEPFIRSK